MLDNIKYNIPSITISLGFLIYILLIVQTSFVLSSVWIMFIIYVWLLSSLYLKSYTLHSFIYVVCSAGIMLSISLFFINGVEELSYPKGALMFNIEGIAKAFFLFFICSVPVILLKTKNNKKPFLSSVKLSKEDVWEKATSEDLRSGDYEPL